MVDFVGGIFLPEMIFEGTATWKSSTEYDPYNEGKTPRNR